MIILDASVVIAFLNTADPHNPRAVELLAENVGEGFGMHPLTLAEVLVGGVRVGRANQLLADLQAIGVMALDSQANEAMILAELRASSGMKMPDCCVLMTALRDASPLATFDERLARTARSLGLSTLPD